MKPYRLFAATGCGSDIAERFLRHAGVPYEVVPLDWDRRAQWKVMDPYNPLRQVPTLVLPNGEVLTETLAIAVHCERLRPGLIPKGKNADRFWRWGVFIVANIYPTFTLRDNAEKFVRGEKAQTEFVANVVKKRKALWRQLYAEYKGPWFLGTQKSAIDDYLAVMTTWGPGGQWFRKEFGAKVR